MHMRSMSILAAVAFIVFIAAAIGSALAAPTLARLWRRERHARRPFPAEWREILRRHVPLVRELPAAQQLRLKKHIQVLLAEVPFIGCAGLEVDDEMRVTIAAQAAFLLLGRGGSFEELESADLVLIAGEAPGELAPVPDLRIKKAARKGARVVAVASGADAKAALQKASRVAIVWDGVDVALGSDVAGAAGADALVYIASSQANARGAEAMGLLPRDGGTDFDGMLAAELGSLAIFSANPVRNRRDGAAVAAALAKIPFVVVSDLFLTETAQVATLVLPAKGAFEKSGTTMNLAGQLLPMNRSLEAPPGALSDLEMLVGLAQQFGIELPTSEALERAVVEAAAKSVPRPLDAASAGSDASRVARPTKLFDGGGTAAHDERIAALRPVVEEAAAVEA